MVFDENGDYTQNTSQLAIQVKSVLKDTLLTAIEHGMTIEEVVYVVHSEVDKILLLQQVNKRLGR